MEHKAWRWSRKTSEKTIIANGRAIEGDEDKETGSSRCPSNLSGRLVFCDCTAKEEQLRKHAKMAEQALEEKEKAETEVAFFKQELDKALQQGEAAEKRLAHLEVALRDCMHEMESLRGEQDESLHDAVAKATMDFERTQKKLEAKLGESNKRVSNLSAENTNLMKALLCKEKLTEDLDKGKAQLEAEFDMLMTRLDSAEEDNNFLKYKCHAMEEEIELLNEEREYGRRSALAPEIAKQIKKLEAECQQLRNLVRKRLQDPTMGNFSGKPSKGTSFLTRRVYEMEEENKTLRDILSLSDGELQSWRTRCGQMASRLAEVEAQLKELSEGRKPVQLTLPGSEFSYSDGISDSESWASALLAELEHFRKGHSKNQPECLALELAEKNDLVDVEKFALVTTGMASLDADNELQLRSKEFVLQKHDSWLDEVLKLILEEHRISKRSLHELLLDIEIVLGCKDGVSKKKDKNYSNISGFLPWKSANPTDIDSLSLQGAPSNNSSLESQNIEDASFAREKIRKHFGFDRSKSENPLNVTATNRHNTLAQMIKIQSALQEESRGMEEKWQFVTEENVVLRKQLQESDQNVGSLRREVDALREMKGVLEDQMENQRLINEDLDTQLTVAKAKLNEILHKLSSLEVELDDKNNCCEELEATCLELQLQLETISRKESPNLNMDQVEMKLRTESIQNWGKQLRVLPSPDTMLIDMALCPTTAAVTDTMAPVLDINSLAPQRSSLRDQMLAEDDEQTEGHMLPSTKQKASNESLQSSPSFIPNDIKALPAPEVKGRSCEQVGTLAIVPSKKPSGGFGFIRKMFLRRKRGCSKMKDVPLQRNTSPLIRQKDVLLDA